MVGAAEAIGGAANEEELRRTYAAALAEAADDDLYEIATLRRAFLERQEHLSRAHGSRTAPKAAQHAAVERDATEPRHKRKRLWQKPSFWIVTFAMVIFWNLFKKLVLKGGL